MIGAFARMIGARQRLLAVEETEDRGWATRSHTPGGPTERKEGRDAPPEGFVERVSDEGGDVYLVPMLEALRDWLRRQRKAAQGEASTLPRLSENH